MLVIWPGVVTEPKFEGIRQDVKEKLQEDVQEIMKTYEEGQSVEG